MKLSKLKSFFVGAPLQTAALEQERLPKWKALAVFSSDALSSVAYATQEILIPLALVSTAAMSWSLPIGLAIALLLAVISSSYWQTIRSYPRGGGAYVVAKSNLGTLPGLVCGAALLIDYVLTAAVSVAAGVEAITSAVPALFEYRVVLGCLALALVTLINLRGIRESGRIFALPTYFFIVSLFALILTGFGQFMFSTITPQAPVLHETYPAISLFLILRAFASGCSALTGIEAITDGVPSFYEPSSRNARITLLWMAFLLGAMFLGVTSLAHMHMIVPSDTQTVISQLARLIFGPGPLYFTVQFATALILFLAANTSFADFPRVCSFLAKDRFLPRQLASLGDRLVFSKGIILLGVCAAGLIVLFGGTTHHLIPLYAVGVFLSFTISQSGMVMHHLRERERNWKFAIVFSAVGAVVTFVVLLVIALTKFLSGAWIIVLLIPAMVMWFRATREHYRKAAVQLAIARDTDFHKRLKHVVVIPISGLHQGAIDAIRYGMSISDDVRVVYVELDESQTDRLKASWEKLNIGIPLVILPSPFRSVVRPIVKYIRQVDDEGQDDLLTVVIPEFVTARWWEGIYHNQTAFLIRAALAREPRKVVTSVRYHLKR